MQQKIHPVGPEHFDDQDRDYAVVAGVELVNALRKLGVTWKGSRCRPRVIGVRQWDTFSIWDRSNPLTH